MASFRKLAREVMINDQKDTKSRKKWYSENGIKFKRRYRAILKAENEMLLKDTSNFLSRQYRLSEAVSGIRNIGKSFSKSVRRISWLNTKRDQ